MIGYEKHSNAYQLWDPKSRRVIISNDVVFNENKFPLRDLDHTSTEELTVLNDQLWDDAWDSSILVTPNESITPENETIERPVEPPEDHSPPSPSPQQQPRRSVRSAQPVERLGNLIGYHTVSDLNQHHPSDIDDVPQHDEPSYLKAMRGSNHEDWLSAMSAEFLS